MLVTGCYLDPNNHSAIVVRIKDGIVTYLTMNVTRPTDGRGAYEVTAQRVSLCTASDSVFAHQYGKFLHNYPVLRAVKIYWRSGLEVTPEAKAVIKLLLAAQKTKVSQ
jgi:hypothetical protein